MTEDADKIKAGILEQFSEVESLWDDIEGITLPEITYTGSAGKNIFNISQELIVVNNHLASFSKYEPMLESLITQLETDIYLAKREKDECFSRDLSELFKDIPADQKKNINLMTGWVKNKLAMKYDAFEKVIGESNRFLVEIKRLYGFVNRRIINCKTSIDVGRAILYALRAEAKVADI